MFLVYIVLILSTCLIPLVLIDMRIKVSEKQFEKAIKNLESMDDNVSINIQKTILNSYQITELKTMIIHIYKTMKWKIRSGYTRIKTHKNNEKT